MSSANDPRVRRGVLATRIVWQEGDVKSQENLLRNDFGQALIHCPPDLGCTLRGPSSLLLDFGRELHGGIQLVVGPTGDYGPIPLRLRFGESVSEAMGEPPSHHSQRDFQISMPSMASQVFGETGFRFVRIDVPKGELPLTACRAMTLMRDLPHRGAFNSSDERLNRIWQVGADTVHLCLQDYVWDGIKRDRAVWIGDLHPETAVVTAVWGNLDIVPQSLDWARDHTPLPAWMNGIGSYSMWWTILQRDWFLAHGNREYLEGQREYLKGLLPTLAEQIQTDGSVEWRGRKFLDWPSSENPAAVHAGLVALLVIALRSGAELLGVLGETSGRNETLNAAARIQTPALPKPNKQASALLALAGLYDIDKVNREVLASEPLRGLSTFYGYYVLQARARAGDYSGCLEVIRRYWGAMLDLGATSFWEDFDLNWTENAGRIDELVQEGRHDVHLEYGNYCYKSLRHSLCHGWAAGPTAWLSEHVLGVRPLEPGCSKVVVHASLCDLDWVEGAYPTPRGTITVRHEKDATGKTRTRTDAPAGVEVIQPGELNLRSG